MTPSDRPSPSPGTATQGRQSDAQGPDAALRRYADILSISADWLWETDAEDRFSFLSESFYKRTGRTPDQALGISRWEVRDRYPETRASADWAWLEAQVRARLPFRDFVYKLPPRQPEGDEVWISTSGQPFFGQDGRYLGYRGIGSDITALKLAETRLQAIIEASGAASYEVDLHTGRLTINDRWAAMVGLRPEEVRTQDDSHWLDLMHPEDRPQVLAEQARCLSGESPRFLAEFRLRHARGHWVSIVSRGRVTRRDAQGRALRLVGANFDITALKEAQNRAERIIRGASVGTWESDLITGQNRVNDVWAAMLGYGPDDMADLSIPGWHALVHPDDLALLNARHEQHLNHGQDSFESEIRLRHRDGHWVWVLSRGHVTQRDDRGQAVVTTGIHLDISETKAREAELRATNERLRQALAERDAAVARLHDVAMRDDLTGALNRRSFHAALQARLQALDQGGPGFCLAMVDLVRFKSVNETHGHGAGDQLLVEIVRRWDLVQAQGGQLFRIGGDEFAVLLSGGDCRRMAALIQDMRAALVQPFRLATEALRMEMSAGLAEAPRDGRTLDELAANADLALFASKVENGRTRVYAPELRQSALQRHEIVQDLLAARVDQDFFLLYQPIIDLGSDRIAGVEALLRWNHPTRGVLTPADFIDVLCSLDMSSTVGDWTLREACRQVAGWNRRLGRELILSVNVFPLQAGNPGFPELVDATLAATGLAASALEIEVTENILLRKGSVAEQVLQGLTRRGIALSLDDFGTGYSSLTSLLDLGPRTLKVDRSFVGGPSPWDRRLALLRSLRHLAAGLGLRTIVEGVENADQAAMVRGIGFDYGQGFHWGRPLTAADLGARLDHQASRG